MNYRLTTSEKTKDRLLKIKNSTNITPNILCRYGIALSLKNDIPLNLELFNADKKGFEFNRNVLTGKYDQLFKALISQKENRFISDEEYFETYLLAHIERGVAELFAEYEMAGNAEKFVRRLVNYEHGRDLT